MKKYILRVAGVFLVIAALFMLVGYAYRARPFLALNVVLDYPQFSTIDDANNIYVIDTSLRRILVSNSDRQLIAEIHGGDRNEGSFYYANNIVVGDNDNFFVLNYVLDKNGMFILREEIIEYDLSGTFQRIFYQRVYASRVATLVQRGEIMNPKAIGNYLYFFLVDDTNIRMIRKSFLRETTEIIGELSFSDANAYVADIEWLDAENFLILDKRGYLTVGNIYGQSRSINYQVENLGKDQPEGAGNLPDDYLWDMSIAGDGNVYITDLINRQIVSMPVSTIKAGIGSSEDSTLIVEYNLVLTRDILLAAGYSDESFIYYQTGYAPEGFVASYDYGIYYGNKSGILEYYESFQSPSLWVLRSALWVTGIILGILALLILFFHAYANIFMRRVSLIVKQLLIIIPLMGGGIWLIATILLQSFVAEHEAGSTDKLLSLTQSMSQNIDGDRFQSITELADYMNNDYRHIRSGLQSSLNYNSDSWNEGLYFALYQVIDDTLYGFMYLNNRIGLRHPFTWYEEPQSAYRSAFDGNVVFERTEDISGNFFYAIAPVYDSQNQVVALLEVGSDLYSFRENAQQLYNQTILLMSLVSAVVMILIMVMTFVILRNLGILRKGVERIAQGEWDHTIKLRSNDEVQELGDRFNYMSTSINNHLKQIEDLNISYQKFFPEAFLTHLDLQSVTEVKLGDQVQKEMSILFSDIRSFTTISEKLKPEENFNFLNEYLRFVGPIIRNNKGFIDKYIGDAVMALFPYKPGEAIQSAVEMLGNLREFNKTLRSRDFPDIQIGVGIHTGKLMLGIIGEQQRMEGTVISDAVNFAARLEGLSKQMGATIVTSEDTLLGLGSEANYMKRYLGRIQVVGKSDAVRVYEVLDGLAEEEIEGKLRTKVTLSEGIRAYEEGDIKTALSQFVAIQVDPFNQKIADLYLHSIEQYYALKEEAQRRGQDNPVWDGILRSSSK